MFEVSDVLPVSFFADSVSFVRLFHFPDAPDRPLSGQKEELWELIYVDHGKLMASVKNRHFILCQNSILIRSQNRRAASCTAFGGSPCAFLFVFSCRSPFLSLLSDQVLSATKLDRLFLAGLLAKAASCAPMPHMEQLLDRLFIRSCLPVLPLLPAAKGPDKRAFPPGFDTRYFTLLWYLKKHLHTRLSVDHICRDNLISRSQLEQLFHEMGWHGVIDCFSHMKIDAAKQMIANSNMTFSQISAALGYSSSHYFSRQFKKETKMTPTEYSFFLKEHPGDVIPSLSHYYAAVRR